MNICFIDNNNISYNHNSLENKEIRGAEKTLINLSLKLNKLGHKITVLNHTDKNVQYENLRWININNYNENITYDLAVSNNDLNNFKYIKSKKNIAISYSIQSIEKFLRKNQLIAFLKYKPKIFLIGSYHKSKRNILTRVFGSCIIDLAVDDIFINTKLFNNIDNNKALFSSYPDRNLDILISIWTNHIYKNDKKLKLFITPIKKNLEHLNIINRKFLNRKELINELLSSRILLVPGHKAELYCLAAEEARELCIPIVTLGIGALRERVIHNKTGFIAKSHEDFANYTLQLFNDNEMWNEIRNNLLNMRNSNNWDLATSRFLKCC
tara:strand:+ start:3443 stop:4417 length:975 start_codon:yes stop_codon:yes gene_type:complete